MVKRRSTVGYCPASVPSLSALLVSLPLLSGNLRRDPEDSDFEAPTRRGVGGGACFGLVLKGLVWVWVFGFERFSFGSGCWFLPWFRVGLVGGGDKIGFDFRFDYGFAMVLITSLVLLWF